MTTKPLGRDLLATRAGGVFDYVSASRLNLWLKCPLAFRLKYIDGVATPPSPAAFLGKAVHMGLETYYRHRQLGLTLSPTEVSTRVNDLWGPAAAEESVSLGTLADEQACRNQALTLLQTYLRHVGATEPKPLAVEVAVEAPLVDMSGEDLGIPLVGIMDLVLPAADGPLIADFKTTARSGDPLEVAHEIQLSCYSYLFRRASPAPESSLEIRNLVKTKLPSVQFHRYAARNQRHFRRLFAAIRAYLDDLHAGRFVFRPGLGCSICDFRRLCPECD